MILFNKNVVGFFLFFLLLFFYHWSIVVIFYAILFFIPTSINKRKRSGNCGLCPRPSNHLCWPPLNCGMAHLSVLLPALYPCTHCAWPDTYTRIGRSKAKAVLGNSFGERPEGRVWFFQLNTNLAYSGFAKRPNT